MKTALHQWLIPFFALMLLGPAAFAGSDEIAQGHTLYVRYCASCHGVKADGHGPAALALKTRPADLRILSKRYGRPLPEDQIAKFIDGRADVAAHGSRDMPVWGDRVWKYPEGGKVWKGPQGRPRELQVAPSIANLVAYLQSIQIDGQHASLK